MLDDVENRQAEQAEEIEQWRQALQKVEGNLNEGQSALAGNVQKMGEIIKGIEARVSKVT
jgi:nuclear migration protein JNM1